MADSAADFGHLTGGFSGGFCSGCFLMEWRSLRRIVLMEFTTSICHRKTFTANFPTSVGPFCKPVEDRLGPKQAMDHYQVQHW